MRAPERGTLFKTPNLCGPKATSSRLWWVRLCGVAALAAIVFASVLLPAKWEQLRTGHWALEHFLAYFVATSVLCLGWPRPFIIAGGLAAIAAPLLEGLQSLMPTHSACLLSVLSGAGGALTAALLITLVSRAQNWHALRRRPQADAMRSAHRDRLITSRKARGLMRA